MPCCLPSTPSMPCSKPGGLAALNKAAGYTKICNSIAAACVSHAVHLCVLCLPRDRHTPNAQLERMSTDAWLSLYTSRLLSCMAMHAAWQHILQPCKLQKSCFMKHLEVITPAARGSAALPKLPDWRRVAWHSLSALQPFPASWPGNVRSRGQVDSARRHTLCQACI